MPSFPFVIFLLSLVLSAGIYFYRVSSVEKYSFREKSRETFKYTVNINSANTRELENLPGIGPSMAKQIIDYRNKNGPYKKIEDLMNVKGIGVAKIRALRGFCDCSH